MSVEFLKCITTMKLLTNFYLIGQIDESIMQKIQLFSTEWTMKMFNSSRTWSNQWLLFSISLTLLQSCNWKSYIFGRCSTASYFLLKYYNLILSIQRIKHENVQLPVSLVKPVIIILDFVYYIIVLQLKIVHIWTLFHGKLFLIKITTWFCQDH